MHILEKYYNLLTEIKIANNEVVTIDPDKPYTVVYLIDGRTCTQVTGIIRGVKGEDKLIVTIPLDADNVNLANIIETSTITKITEYSFEAHFENFNNWIGVEVAERSRIDLRVKFTGGENIVSVEQGNRYSIGYVEKVNGVINYVTGIGTIRSIIRSTTREAMPQHINHFTNDIDYMLVVKFDDVDDLKSINVIDIRHIILAYTVDEASTIDTEPLRDLIAAANEAVVDPNLYLHRTYDAYLRALNDAYRLLAASKIYEEDVTMAYNNLKRAMDGLLLKADEKDLITYSKKDNTLYCDESGCQILIEGIMESEARFNKIKFFTNFGTEKEIVAPDGLNVFWSHYGDNVEEALAKSNGVKFTGFVREPFYLVCNRASLGEVYLGYKAQETINTNGIKNYRANSVKAAFNNCYVNNIYAGGYGLGYISSGNMIQVNASDVGCIYGGSMIPIEDRNKEQINERSCRISIMNSSVRTAYTGGVNSHSDMVELHLNSVRAESIYLTGKDYAVTYGAAVVIDNSMINQIEFIAKLATSYSALCSLENTSVARVVVGCNGASGQFEHRDNTESTNDNKLQLIIQEGTYIEELMLGGDGVTKIDKKFVDVIKPKSIVVRDYDNLIPDHLE